MSEINRVALKSIGSNKVDSKKIQETGKSVRIALILPESNEDTCPEYNYKEELAAAKKKDKPKENKTVPNGLDPFFDNDDDDVRRIAQQMEAKYGATVPSKKKRKGRPDDYADIGAGYDESDSFIDNTDGYDEMIPQNVTTLFGGFYINSGALEFKTDDEASSDISSSSNSEDENDVKPSRKRKIESSDESEGENETDNPEISNLEKKPKQHTDTNNGKILKKKIISKEGIKPIKKINFEEKKKLPTVKEMLIEEGADLNVSLPTDILKMDSTTTVTDSDNDKKENKQPMSLDNVDDAIESVIKSSKVLLTDNANNSKVVDTKDIEIVINNNSIKQDKIELSWSHSDGENSSNDATKLDLEIVKLPENLPKEILVIIDKIKSVASKTTEGKVKFFSGPVSDMLLSLERKFKCLGKQSRMRVYEHLAPFLKCRKETIIRRAKNLVFIEERKKMMHLLAALKNAINKVMLPLLENYQIESQKVMQRKFSKESVENEEMKHMRMPKRRFSWTEQIKKLFKEIIILKKRCFLLESKNKVNLETQMENFIKTEIQILWPEGWMSMRALLKLYNNVTETKKPTETNNVNKKIVSKTSLNSNSTQVNSSSKDMQKIASNSTLSIIPVGSNKLNAENNIKNDIVIDKILTNDTSSNKIIKSLPIDISKTSNTLTITPTTSASLVNVHINEERNKMKHETKKSIINEVIILEEKPKKSVIETPPTQNNNTSDIIMKIESKHCQIIDLTDSSDIKKKPGPKSKTKFFDDDKQHSKQNDLKSEKQEVTASSAYNNLIKESLTDLNRFAQNSKSSSSATNLTNSKLTDHSIKKLSTPSSYTNTIEHNINKIKTTNDGDDIQKVMEGLKALQNMSTPVKSETTTTSSPQPPSYSKSEYNSGFQEAFQRQLLNDFHLMKNNVGGQSTPTSSKSHYNNSIDKFPHSNNIGYSTEKYFQTSNNYAPTSSKLNSAHQTGTYSVLDDMLSNFFTDYGYPKSANHKQKPSHSHK